MVPDMPFLAQLVYREYHTRVQALQSTQQLVPPPEDTPSLFQPHQEVGAPIEQNGREMEMGDLSEERTETISLEMENQLPLKSEMSVTTHDAETIPATESHTRTTEEETVEEKQEETNQQVTETETEPMEQ